MNRRLAGWTLIAMLAIVMVACFASMARGQTVDPRQDTTYTTGPDQGNAAGIYPHYFRLTRGDSLLGIVLQGNASAGSCANAWCALVPSNATNGVGQSGGKFASFSAAAHQVVLVWNSLHPYVAPPVVVPPVDTTPAPVPSTVDSSYTQTQVACPAGKWRTCYVIRQHGVVAGWVQQIDTTASRRWVVGRDAAAFPPPYETTLKAAALRVVLSFVPPVVVPPSPVDTTHKTIYVYDTVRTTVTMPTDTVRPRVILPVDTVVMRVGDPPLVLQAGDTVKIPVRVLPKCSCDSTVVKDSTPTAAGAPELPRYTAQMDAMLASARASDTVTRQVFDQTLAPPWTPVPRKDASGAFVCSRIVRSGNVEQPAYFPCPQAVLDAVAARNATTRVQSMMAIPVRKEPE